MAHTAWTPVGLPYRPSNLLRVSERLPEAGHRALRHGARCGHPLAHRVQKNVMPDVTWDGGATWWTLLVRAECCALCWKVFGGPTLRAWRVADEDTFDWRPARAGERASARDAITADVS